MKSRTLFIYIISLLSIFSIISCGDDESKHPDDVYYIKYEINTSSRRVYSNIMVDIMTENGLDSRAVPKEWEGTFGPVKGNTWATLNAYLPDDYYNTTSFYGRISISKNGSPFVLKAERRVSDQALEMEYSIDGSARNEEWVFPSVKSQKVSTEQESSISTNYKT